MDGAVVRNAIGTLDNSLASARDALFDVAREGYGVSAYGEARGSVDPRRALRSYLEEAYDILLIVLEAASMPKTRASLIKAWREFSNGKGREYKIDDDNDQSCHSPILTFLVRLIDNQMEVG